MKLLSGIAIICAPLLAFILLAEANAHSQKQMGALKGRVRERDGKALEGVIVRATNAENKEDKRETKSDYKGDFEFVSLPAGRYSLSFEKQGYKTFNTRVFEISAGE